MVAGGRAFASRANRVVAELRGLNHFSVGEQFDIVFVLIPPVINLGIFERIAVFPEYECLDVEDGVHDPDAQVPGQFAVGGPGLESLMNLPYRNPDLFFQNFEHGASPDIRGAHFFRQFFLG